MTSFTFTGRFTHNGEVTADHTVTVQMSNVLNAALEAGHRIRAHFASQGLATGHLAVERVATDPHAATREAGRKAGLTEAQISRFIARQA